MSGATHVCPVNVYSAHTDPDALLVSILCQLRSRLQDMGGAEGAMTDPAYLPLVLECAKNGDVEGALLDASTPRAAMNTLFPIVCGVCSVDVVRTFLSRVAPAPSTSALREAMTRATDAERTDVLQLLQSCTETTSTTVSPVVAAADASAALPDGAAMTG